MSPQAATVARPVAGALSAGLVAFQVALAAGAPWGHLAWGGGYDGALPTQLRVASGVSALLWVGASAAGLTRRDTVGVRRARTAYAAIAVVGTATNAISPSTPERLLWTPVAAALAVSFLTLARRPTSSGSVPAR